MRKGMTLIEMLVVIAVIPFVLIILDGLYQTILRDIPRSSRVVQENTTILNMLKQMQKDIDAAKGLPKSFAGHTSNDERLLIAMANGVISYQLKNGQIARRELTDTRQDKAKDPIVWSAPNATVQWQVWRKAGAGYAVEVKAFIKLKSE